VGIVVQAAGKLCHETIFPVLQRDCFKLVRMTTSLRLSSSSSGFVRFLKASRCCGRFNGTSNPCTIKTTSFSG